MSTTHHPVINHSCTHPEFLRVTPCPPFAPAFHIHHKKPQGQLPCSMTSPMFRASYLFISFLSALLVFEVTASTSRHTRPCRSAPILHRAFSSPRLHRLPLMMDLLPLHHIPASRKIEILLSSIQQRICLTCSAALLGASCD